MPDFNNINLGTATAGEKVRDFNSQEMANTVWAMAKTGTCMPKVFETLCTAAGEKVQDFNSPEIANTLLARCNTPEVFEALCMAADEKVQDFNSQEIANSLWAR